MKFLNIWFLILIFFFNILFINFAKSQELQARYQDWSVFKTERGDKIICYMASTPIKSEGNFDKRGEPFFLLTKIDNDSDEISTSSGFIYNKTSNVEVNFGSKKYYLFPYKTIAWANDKNDDADIIKEMQKNPEMIVSGIARDGKIAIDSYSLIGFVQSYKKIKELCQNH
jgi:hypothetical protein